MAQCSLNTINMILFDLLAGGVLVCGVLLINFLADKGYLLMRQRMP